MHYHLIGISGISMSGLAKILESQGHKVSGSDLKLGGHKKENITAGINKVIISSAVRPGSPAWVEVAEAKRLGIPVIKRSKAIGEIMKKKFGITVSGMHGKTTVSAMIVTILEDAGLDPLILVGGIVKKIGSQVKTGRGNYFVAEACEYDRSFLDFYPKIAVITNIEREHLDYYTGGLPEIIKTFSQFIKQLPKQGVLVFWGDDKNIKKAIELSKRNDLDLISFGFGKKNRYQKMPVTLKIPGKHNILNALAASAAADYLKINRKISLKTLKNFTGAGRRFEIKGRVNGVTIVDDYGHHPTEIAATISAAREFFPKRRLMIIFQPHQYSRTKIFFKDFVRVLAKADLAIIAPIHAVVGRDEKREISSEELVDAINHLHLRGVGGAIYVSDYEGIVEYLLPRLKRGDVVITIGATEIYKVGDLLLKILSSKKSEARISKLETNPNDQNSNVGKDF